MTISRADLEAWAAARGVRMRWPEELCLLDPSESSRVDFGRCLELTPAFVMEPRDEDQLSSCMRLLRDAGMKYKLRGASHSSGGQTLIDGGAVIDLRGLAGVVSDDPDHEEITVRGGSTWAALIEHLAPQGRRPLTLTSSFRATVAGTLAVGGFGDATHLHGVVAAGVRAITLITPDGERRVLRPGAELFDYTLAGRGQLGAIASVTLVTVRRPLGMSIRGLQWASFPDFARDALIIRTLRIYELLRARLMFRQGSWEVHGMVGHLTDAPPDVEVPVDLYALKTAEHSNIVRLSITDHLPDEEGDEWVTTSCPAVEIAVPLPGGLEIWADLGAELEAAGMIPYLDAGAAVTLVARQALPLAPVPDADYSILIAIRPKVPVAKIAEVVPRMRQFAARAIAAGARLYLMSVEPDGADRDLIRRQFGERWARWVALKRDVDPDGLCNPGLLDE